MARDLSITIRTITWLAIAQVYSVRAWQVIARRRFAGGLGIRLLRVGGSRRRPVFVAVVLPLSLC